MILEDTISMRHSLEPASPCIGVCRLDTADICVGCGRSRLEVAEWLNASPARRRQIARAASARRGALPVSSRDGSAE
jgi:uncharacterized protein